MPEPVPEITDIAEFVRHCSPLLEFPGAQLSILTVPPSPRALVDRGLLREVLTNLVKNAAEAMPGGGRVVIGVGSTTHGGRAWATIDIEDSGPGVASGDLERIFEPHVTTKAGGSGLGLAIVERIVGAHGGRIDVTASINGGAIFRVWLPAVLPGESA